MDGIEITGFRNIQIMSNIVNCAKLCLKYLLTSWQHNHHMLYMYKTSADQ